MTTGEIHHLRHLCFGHFKGKDPDNSETLFVHGQHDVKGLRMRQTKKPFQDMHDKFHRGVVVIQQQHLVHRRPLCARLGFGKDARITSRPIGLVRHRDG